MVYNLLALLFNLDDSSFLLNNQRIHVLEQLGKLGNLLLNLLQLPVTVLHGAEGGASSTLPIALHQSLGKDLLVAGTFNDGLDFLGGSVGAHDLILTGHLLLGRILEIALFSHVLSNSVLELLVDNGDMASVHGTLGLWVRLDGSDALRKRAVVCHGLGGEGIQLTMGGTGRGAVGIVENSSLEHLNLREVAQNTLDFAANGGTLVQNGVRVSTGHGACVLGQGGHLDVVSITTIDRLSLVIVAATTIRLLLVVVAALLATITTLLLLLTIATLLRLLLLLTIAALLPVTTRGRIPLVVGVLVSSVSIGPQS